MHSSLEPGSQPLRLRGTRRAAYFRSGKLSMLPPLATHLFMNSLWSCAVPLALPAAGLPICRGGNSFARRMLHFFVTSTLTGSACETVGSNAAPARKRAKAPFFARQLVRIGWLSFCPRVILSFASERATNLRKAAEGGPVTTVSGALVTLSSGSAARSNVAGWRRATTSFAAN